MKYFSLVALAALTLFLAGCGKDHGSSASVIKQKEVSGVSQKGPFVNGSAVHIYELNASSLSQTGKIFTGKIKSDKGDFSIENIELNSPYVLFEASGYYLNEVTGKKSAGTLTLFAISDLKNRDNVNINLLTHLEYERVSYLMKKKKKISEAKAQAEEEIFASFGIDEDAENFEDLNIFEKSEADAALLAISIILQGDRSEGELSDLLSKYALDIEEDGEWDNDELKKELADWALSVYDADKFAAIRKNIEDWEYGDVPNFEKYIMAFANHVYGCNKENADKEISNHVCSVAEDGSYELVLNKEGMGTNGAWTYEDGASFSFNYGGKKYEAILDAYSSQMDGVGDDYFDWPVPYAGYSDDFNAVIESCKGVCGKANRIESNMSDDYLGFTIHFTVGETESFDITDWGGLCVESTGDFAIEVKPSDEAHYTEYGNYSYNITEDGVIDIPWEYFAQPIFGKKVSLEESLKRIVGIKVRFDGSSKFDVKAIGPMGTCGKTTVKPEKSTDGDYSDSGDDGYVDYDYVDCDTVKAPEEPCEKDFSTIDTYKMSCALSYVCYDGEWYKDYHYTWQKTDRDDYLNPEIKYGTITDKRDGKTYKTVDIGPITWMAQNLDYRDETKTPNLKGNYKCTDEDPAQCVIAGAIYTWSAAMDIPPDYKEADLPEDPDNHQGICPDGWRIPNSTEMDASINAMGNDYTRMFSRYVDYEGRYSNASYYGGVPIGVSSVSVSSVGASSTFESYYDDPYGFSALPNYGDQEPRYHTSTYIYEYTPYEKLDYVPNESFLPVRCVQYNTPCNESNEGGVVNAAAGSMACHDGVWQQTTETENELANQVCSKNYEEFVNERDNEQYMCYEGVWYKVSEFLDGKKSFAGCEKDFQITTFKDDDDKVYSYVCYDGKLYMDGYFVWKKTNKDDYLNPNIDYGELKDSRDGKTYKTIDVGPFTWMAQNLDYRDVSKMPNLKDNVLCYNDNPAQCAIIGAHYTWTGAMNLASSYKVKSAASVVTPKHQGVCPSGWWVPDTSDWRFIVDALDGYNGTMFAVDGSEKWKKATDDYGFSALPTEALGHDGGNARFNLQLADEYPAYGEGYAYGGVLEENSFDNNPLFNGSKSDFHSVRCVQYNTACDAKNDGSIITVGESRLICSSGIWRIPTETELDAEGHKCSKNYETITGKINKDRTYVCYEGSWYQDNDFDWEETDRDAYLNPSIKYGELKDSRDGLVYKTVKIGEQTWMAQNLNYADSAATPNLKGYSECYNNNPAQCSIVGRLYSWTAALNIAESYLSKDASLVIKAKHQGICPSGWHVPSKAEWETLLAVEENMEARKLFSKLWETSEDEYGFSIIPGGESYGGWFGGLNEYASFVTADQLSKEKQYYFHATSSELSIGTDHNKSQRFSLRCVKD